MGSFSRSPTRIAEIAPGKGNIGENAYDRRHGKRASLARSTRRGREAGDLSVLHK
jgi:hypothetical protein